MAIIIGYYTTLLLRVTCREEGMCTLVDKYMLIHTMSSFIRNASQQTPLHCAASGGFDEVVTVLINAQAQVSSTDKDGKNALDLAIDNGQE